MRPDEPVQGLDFLVDPVQSLECLRDLSPFQPLPQEFLRHADSGEGASKLVGGRWP